MLGERRNKLLLLVGGVIVLGLFFVAFLIFRNDKKPANNEKKSNTVIVKDDQVGLVVSRDPSLQSKTVQEAAKEVGQLWNFKQPANSQQEFVIDANYEQGESLKKLTGYTKQALRDSVVNNVNLQLPKQYPGYEELTQRNLTVNGTEANETVFEYSVSGTKVKQRLLLLFKNSSTAVYIRAQAPTQDYAEVNKRYFEPIFSSAEFE